LRFICDLVFEFWDLFFYEIFRCDRVAGCELRGMNCR
jgi:hypothetical protein